MRSHVTDGAEMGSGSGVFFFFSSRRRHTRFDCDWSSDVCSSDLGRRRLPSRQSVLVFSPHPDDDVISMGGVLRKLWENENATVVAYMTSGNIAVFDHDVRRHLDFVSRAAETLGLDRAAVQRARDGVE